MRSIAQFFFPVTIFSGWPFLPPDFLSIVVILSGFLMLVIMMGISTPFPLSPLLQWDQVSSCQTCLLYGPRYTRDCLWIQARLLRYVDLLIIPHYLSQSQF